MVYNEAAFRWDRVQAYAQKVAQARKGAECSYTEHWETVTSGLLFKKAHSNLRKASLEGWILIQDPVDGIVYCQNAEGSPAAITRGYEEGRFLLLSRDGKLKTGEYRIDLVRNSGTLGNGEQVSIISLDDPDPLKVRSFDQLNRHHYRHTRVLPGEAWREELGKSFTIKVKHPGMETTLALKAFLEHGRYQNSLTMKY